MGSDVSIINSNFVESDKSKIKIDNRNFKYPTGEQIIIKYKTLVKVQLAKYFELSMLIAEININCILGVDFLRLFGLQKIFDFTFLNSITESNVEFNCSRIKSVTTFPSNLISLYEGSS